jgi:large subunit ribosomal protein L4e
MAAARPLVAVQKIADDDNKSDQLVMPAVFLAPIRPDIVHFVHTSMAKNKRQPYAVSKKAGHQHSAESWGTGRAVSRIPRVSGGGTSRAGQGAFGNMCRSGRMFAPTKTWRKWHRRINTNQKRFAVASALAASALPSLVMARGHRVEQVAEVPLVMDTSAESLLKTKKAIDVLVKLGAYPDVQRAKDSRKIRRGKGKMRDRRHVMRRGPLVVYNEDHGIAKAFRNLPGVELAQVDRLNLLQLAPGGHLGRFIIWTRAAFDKLNGIYGSTTRVSTSKNGYKLPRNIMFQTDLTRLINSDEIQSKVRAALPAPKKARHKKNPLKNFGVKVKLNPYAMSMKRSELLTLERRRLLKEANMEARRKGVPETRSLNAARKIARNKTHEARQKVNFTRITTDDFKAPEATKYTVFTPSTQVGGKTAPAK